MEAGRAASGVPLLPRVAVPLVDTQAVRELLTTISSGGYNAQLASAVQLARLLEVEEGRFRDVVGDPWGAPAGQRSAHSIGKLLACIKDRENMYDTVAESWVLSRSAPLEQQVAGSRFILACLSCWGFQYPLTEERCMEQLLEWADEAGDDTPAPLDPPPSDDEALLREARSVYATGLLSIAMANEEYAGQASSTPLVPRVVKYLRKALLDQPPPPPPAAPAPPPPLQPEAAGAGSGACTAASTAAASPQALCHSVSQLRRLRLQYCAALLGDEGEYMDALGPVLAERGAEALIEMMRRCGGATADQRMLYDALAACVALTAHRRFSEQFVEAGGMDVVLALPRNPHTYAGIAMLLYSLAAAPLAFERLLEPAQPAGAAAAGAAVSSEGVGPPPQRGGGGGGGGGRGGRGTGAGPVISAALSLLGCGQDTARKTAVTFLSSCMHFPACLREFQAQDGMRRMLNLLRALLTSLRSASPPDLRLERQVGYYAAVTLRMFVATHLVLHVGALRRGLALTTAAAGTGAGAGTTAPQAVPGAAAPPAAAQPPPASPYRPVDTSREALDALVASLESDRRLAEAFVRCRWAALEAMLDCGLPGTLLELVAALPPERWFHESAQAALEAIRLLTVAPLARRVVVAAVVPVGGAGPGGGGGAQQQQQQRSGMGVLLGAATLSVSAFFASDPEVVAEALSSITNCVTPPPSLASLLPAAAGTARIGQAAAGAGVALHGATPARRLLLGAGAGTGAGGAGGAAREAYLQSESAGPAAEPEAGMPGDQGHRGGSSVENQQSRGPAATSAPATAAAAVSAGASPLDLGPPVPALGQALEAGYVLARQAVRQTNGIRALIQLLQPRHGQGPNAMPQPALDRIRALACRALVGLAGDPAIRQILTRLQLARLLSDLVREPVGATRRPGGVSLEMGAAYPRSGSGQDWHAAFTSVALELITMTTTGAGPMVRHVADKFATANDATAPALHKIERAAIAAASHVTYYPPELLLLLYEHLRAAGLHAAATTLATEANLPRVSAALHKITHLGPPGPGPGPAEAGQVKQVLPPAAGGAPAPGAAGSGLGGQAQPRGAAAGAGAAAGPAVHLLMTPAAAHGPLAGAQGASAPGTAACTPFSAAAGAQKIRPIAVAAALRSGGSGARSRSDLSNDLARLNQHHQHQGPPAAALQAEPAADQAPGSLARQPAAGGIGQQTTVAEQHHGRDASHAQQQQQPGRSGLKRRASTPLPPAAHPCTRSTAAAAAPAAAQAGAAGTAAAANGAAVPATAAAGAQPKGGKGRAAATPAAAVAGGRASTRSGSTRRRAEAAAAQDAAAKGSAGAVGQPINGTPIAVAVGPGAPADAPSVATGPGSEDGRLAGDLPAAPSAATGAVAGIGTGAGSGGPRSDGDYLARAFGQQQQQQQQSGVAAVDATPQVAVRTRALASPFATAAADRPSRPTGGTAAPTAATVACIASRNPLLTRLPSRRGPASAAGTAATAAGGSLRRHSSASTAAAAAAAIASGATPAGGAVPPVAAVPELPDHVEAAVRDLHVLSRPPVLSKLHNIVMSYLRQQHRQAVMQSAVPTAMLPPIPLSRPYVMPQATHALDAPACVTRRVARREQVGGHGGRGGARADTQLIYSRFRPLRTFRNDSGVSLCGAFLQGWRYLVVGTHAGELRLHDPVEGEVLDELDAHAAPVMQLRSFQDTHQPLLLSSSRAEVKLWMGGGTAGEDSGLSRGPRATLQGATRGSFHPAGSQIVAVSSSSPRQALIFDVRTATKIAVLDPPSLAGATAGGPSSEVARGAGGAGRTPREPWGAAAVRGLLGNPLGGVGSGGGGEAAGRRPGSRGGTGQSTAACYSPTGEMMLWGNCLYDMRARAAVHQFDQFTDSGSGAFHPAGLEVIQNSEVWDLRTFRLLRSVPALDGASVLFSGGGDVLYAFRRQADEPFSQALHPRRARHPLHMAFRTLDASSYADIATVAVEKAVLDLAVEPTDSLVGVVALDVSDEGLTSCARVYEVGRRRPAEDESDAEDEEDDDEDDSDGGSEDEDEEVILDGSDLDTPAPTRRPRTRGGGAEGGARRGGNAVGLRFVADMMALGEEDAGEDEEGGQGDVAGLMGGGNDGEDSGDEDDDEDDGVMGTEDDEVGMAMLEDAYAALEDVYGGDGDEENEDMDGEDDDFDEDLGDGEDDEALMEAFLAGQEDEEDEDEEDEDEGDGDGDGSASGEEDEDESGSGGD